VDDGMMGEDVEVASVEFEAPSEERGTVEAAPDEVGMADVPVAIPLATADTGAVVGNADTDVTAGRVRQRLGNG